MKRSSITVVNLHGSYRLRERRIAAMAAAVLKFLKKPAATRVEIIFLDDRSMRKLNRRYKRRDRPTDVLSFTIEDRMLGRGGFLGEAFISLDTAARNAKVFGVPLAEEALRYVIHAILHIFGYEDYTRSDRARMSRKEETILRWLCRREDLSTVLTRR